MFKQFINGLRSIELEIPCILLNENCSPKLCEFIYTLDQIRFVDGARQAYYGEIKVTITHFITYWSDFINDAVCESDAYCRTITKDVLLQLYDKTISMQQIKQVDFGKGFLPVQTPSEQRLYEAIEEKYKSNMESLVQIKTKIDKFHKIETIKEFAQVNLELSLERIRVAFDYTHTFIAANLALKMPRIRISLEDILLRMRKNLQRMLEERNEIFNKLLHQLYDKNKELLFVSRQEHTSSADKAQIDSDLKRLRDKFEDDQVNVPIVHLETEVKYWEGKLKEFNQLDATLNKLITENENVKKQEEVYNTLRTTEFPGYTKYCCWAIMGDNFKLRKMFLDKTTLRAMKAIITFFAIRGTNRIIYLDNIGPYYLDEFGHQNYTFDHGNYKKVYHITCDGSFRRVNEMGNYYYDSCGRYETNENGEKLYKVAPCCSTYKLGDNELLVKITKDCGHSEKVNEECGMQLKDPTDVEILPTKKGLDIKSTLKRETVKYLWDSLGHLLPKALHDVGIVQPKNPIHHLAHRLLVQKYSKTIDDLLQKKTDAEVYRAKIYAERKEKAVSASKAWKAQQVKRRKPEESDDTLNKAIYDTCVAQKQFINALDFYN